MMREGDRELGREREDREGSKETGRNEERGGVFYTMASGLNVLDYGFQDSVLRYGFQDTGLGVLHYGFQFFFTV